jgi:hypothetical protein
VAAGLLNSAIAQALSQHNLNEKTIQWGSPLKEDTYSEYRDSEFLERVGLAHLVPALRKFWPRNGPCWDALARIESGCVLIEAKSRVAVSLYRCRENRTIMSHDVEYPD